MRMRENKEVNVTKTNDDKLITALGKLDKLARKAESIAKQAEVLTSELESVQITIYRAARQGAIIYEDARH